MKINIKKFLKRNKPSRKVECKETKTPERPEEWITTPAVRTPDGTIFTGHSHTQIWLENKLLKFEDGFMTNKNRFVDRKEASQIAYIAKQIEYDNGYLLSGSYKIFSL